MDDEEMDDYDQFLVKYTKEDDKTKEEDKSFKEEKPPRRREKHERRAKTNNTGKKIIIVIVVAVVLFLLSIIFSLFNMFNSNIIKGIKINGIDVSGLTQQEAKDKITKIIEYNKDKDITFKSGKAEKTTNFEVLEVKYDLDEALKKATEVGRSDNIFLNNIEIAKALLVGENIDLEFSYNNDKVENLYQEIVSQIDGKVEEVSYYIENDQLYITKGKDGYAINKQTLYDEIGNLAYNLDVTNCIINLEKQHKVADQIDLEKIKKEIYKKPANAYITENPFEVHASVDGVDFAISMEEAKKLIKEDKEEYVIPLTITKADIQVTDLGNEIFKDELGAYTTRFDPSNTNRSTNIRLAASKINEVVILPGETFSYNQTVGKRTIDSGFKEAGAYAGGKVIQEVGGGICQVSSTLYNACLYANLEIVARSNHCFEPSYVDAGRDATVSWGSVDYKFKNNRKYPIKVIASGTNGVVSVKIMGLKEEGEPTVKVTSNKTSVIKNEVKYEYDASIYEGEQVTKQSGHDGCTSVTYLLVYKDGKEEKILLSRDTYNALETIIAKGTKKREEKPVEPEPENTNNTNEQTNTVTNETTDSNTVADNTISNQIDEANNI